MKSILCDASHDYTGLSTGTRDSAVQRHLACSHQSTVLHTCHRLCYFLLHHPLSPPLAITSSVHPTPAILLIAMPTRECGMSSLSLPLQVRG